ncbi:GntR family transcriptional regulator [Nocardioides donggukensis]|uniref:GntR family transcriptional regulator n=1 Tax=Nocardioides donggukensis TaxID=2774019 RepID=A0A927PYH3_9ACTN|nr:GntR family transcriptional regulator [Nocardioides donggukensis]MBD8868153.1 GntR family transcriptional regulator [Nocardioides donggukensis]
MSQFDSLSLEVTSTVDRVVEELRRALFDGELEAGTPLREMAIADSLGISRSTVREALGVLVAEGLAVRLPNRGVQVASPDPASVRDLCRARAVLEAAGVRGWPAADEQQRDAVRRALVDYTAAVHDGASYQTLNERHLAIHLSLVGLLGSPRLVATAETLSAELRLALAQIDRIRRNAHDQAGSHTHLLRLLERGDVEAAAAEIGHHLEDAEVAILAALAPES